MKKYSNICLYVCAVLQSQCQQELDKVLENISQMTFHDNKGPLENLYDLKFPNCDKTGQYNLKQVKWSALTSIFQRHPLCASLLIPNFTCHFDFSIEKISYFVSEIKIVYEVFLFIVSLKCLAVHLQHWLVD